MSKNKDHLASVRKFCLSLPEVEEFKAMGTIKFQIKGKGFAIYAENHHGDDRLGLWLKSTFDRQEILLEFDPDRFFKPAYVGARGWIGLHLEKFSDTEMKEQIREAYKLVAPDKLLRKINRI
ncbi:MmcQ/YjbR family DNA-binding protein [Leptospira wolffii]|uniref:MmcQ/YjbR family DNA-binding protein n=1 Tax=Leptospira wolffii TaxID=409998 RepID=UPI0010828B02|nr:MmcQ/YjbR family DNA-binding protein [Leptospira wolffii]TGL50594.1 MmcQ/YjbR family DNA-binding protein [Leptospira wolffii]